MTLYSFTFLAIFFLVFIVFWKIPHKYKWVILLLFSYFFYGSQKPMYVGVIILTTLVTYFSAILMHRYPGQKKRFLIFSVLCDLLILLIFKYFNFFSLSIQGLWGFSVPQFKYLVPIGISFYTLQIVGYLIDVYKGKIIPEKRLGIFALFVCFFPQLTAGPIERSTTLLPQLKKKNAFDYGQTANGIKLFTFGLFKKLVIADNLGIVVDRAFSSLHDFKGLSLIILIFLYSWQIYMDFSGYTDMARGIAKMIGINLMENFDLPYFSKSIRDFWRRWHISFSSWLRDYVYFPLGGSRKGIIRTVVNTMIVFAISGLWHGAAWNFVFWGILHGLGISAERIARKFIPTPVPVPDIIKIAYTYCCISIFWIFFRAGSLEDELYILRQSVTGIKNFASPHYIWASLEHLFVFDTAEIIITFGLLFGTILLEVLRRKTSYIQLINRQPMAVRFAVYSLIVFMIIELRNIQIIEFIYTRF